MRRHLLWSELMPHGAFDRGAIDDCWFATWAAIRGANKQARCPLWDRTAQHVLTFKPILHATNSRLVFFLTKLLEVRCRVENV
jgi:hypothetical protein